MKSRWIAFALTGVGLLVAGCSSSPPRPELAQGEFETINSDAQSLAELLEIARNGMPRRYKAERGADLHQTFERWTKTAGLRLQWESAYVPTTVAAVDEFDVRSAIVAVAQQFRSDAGNLIVEFPNAKTVRVFQLRDAQGASCPDVPAGAIVLGVYCMATPAPVVVWYIDPSDKMLSDVFKRWAETAGVQLRWNAKMDWPLHVENRKGFEGDLLQALNSLTETLTSRGANLRFSVTAKELAVDADRIKETTK
jgi:hypothetical protein